MLIKDKTQITELTGFIYSPWRQLLFYSETLHELSKVNRVFAGVGDAIRALHKEAGSLLLQSAAG